MFRQVLFTQWKWARTELFLYVIAGFLVPTIIIRVGFSFVDSYSTSSVLSVGQYAGVFFGGLAMLAAVGLAWRPYIIDAALKHVGPLSLPVPWAMFVRLRFVAGAVLMLIPTIAVWIGSIAATAAAPIPPTLHAYPTGLAIRFYLSALTAYAAAFLLQYVAGRNATRVAVAILLVVALMETGSALLGFHSPMVGAWNVLTTWPGPFSTFSGIWMLIDV